MRMLFGLLSLLLVVYVVLQLARTQLHALRPTPPAASASAPQGAAARTPQQQVVEDLNKALQSGQERAASAAD